MFRSSGGQEGDGYWQRQIKGIYTPHVVGSNCLVVAHLLTLLSRLLRIQSASTTILLLSFRSSRYFLFLFPILVFPIPPPSLQICYSPVFSPAFPIVYLGIQWWSFVNVHRLFGNFDSWVLIVPSSFQVAAPLGPPEFWLTGNSIKHDFSTMEIEMPERMRPK